MQIALIIFILAITLTYFYSLVRGIGYVPTSGKDVQRFLALAQIKPGQKMYDLGAGDGRMTFAAAQAEAHATGFEVSLIPYIICLIAWLWQKNKKYIKIKFKDFWLHDLSDADLVYFFLIPRIYPKLKEKFEKELRPGAKVIAYVWPIDGWTPDTVDKPVGQKAMYVYTIK